METVWSKKSDEILSIGHYLEKDGIKNWALAKDQALKALDRFLAAEIPILGGDVYENNNGVFSPNYDNWHSDFLPGESESDFLRRSINESKMYIEKYKKSQPDKLFFGLVPQR